LQNSLFMRAIIYMILLIFVIYLTCCATIDCTNRMIDGDETGVDCGGSCPDCPPIVFTSSIYDITNNSSTCYIKILNETGTNNQPPEIKEYGVCYAEVENVENCIYSVSRYEYSSYDSVEYFTLASLNNNTTYYVKGFVRTDFAVAYGNEVSFKTQGADSGLPIITTNIITNITNNSAKSGGNVIDEGSSSVTARGVCWNTTPNPTTSNFCTVDGTGVGSYESELNSLSSLTTYYVRAYANNTYGTSYGEQLVFTTIAWLPYIATSPVTNITANTAICGGYGISDGGSAIISKGVCWSTQGNPTINDSKTNDGSTTADFVSSITNLNPETTYYVRAYAINSNGVNYGSQRIFETLPISCGNNVSDADENIYETVQIGSQCWLKSNLRTTKFSDNTNIALVEGNSWGSLTSAAFCYYQNNYSNYGETYGALYNWYAVSSNKLCPLGWHVPSDEEWLELATFCTGVDGAGGMLKEEGTNHWNSPNTGASNYYSFTALPGGGRMPGGVLILFEGINDDCNLWTSTSYNSTRSIYFNMSSQTALLYRNNWDNHAGFSVRCVKD